MTARDKKRALDPDLYVSMVRKNGRQKRPIQVEKKVVKRLPWHVYASAALCASGLYMWLMVIFG